MANSHRACRHCKKFIRIEDGLKIGRTIYCDIDCKIGYALAFIEKKRAKKTRTAKAEFNKKVKAVKQKEAAAFELRKKRVRTRAKWFNELQKLVNQYVSHVKEKDQPCCTCGTANPHIKYDAGHYISRGACPELRFELTNIHRQCSVRCNGFKSGNRAEYDKYILKRYGQAHFDWLNGPHVKLKMRFPHWSDIENEMIRYRKLLRDNGLKPVA
jgi:hypothetical protein